MKFISLFLLFFLVLVVHAQRRTTSKPVTDQESSPSPPSRGRGRSRYVATQEHVDAVESVKTTSEPSNRRIISSRKRVSEATSERKISPRLTTAVPLKSEYEVEEFVNESPIDSFRRVSKPRVLTETHFEATNIHRKSLLGLKSSSGIPPALFKNTENVVNNVIIPDTSTPQYSPDISSEETEEVLDSTLKTNALDSSENTVTEDYKGDFTKTVPISTSPKPTEIKRVQNGARRNGNRSRLENTVVANPTTQASRPRGRTRPTRKPDDTSTSSSQIRTIQRGSRRRVDQTTPLFEPAKIGPSVFTAEPVHHESRSRLGRKIDTSAPEKITIDITSNRNGESSKRRTVNTPTPSSRKPANDYGRRSGSRSDSREAPVVLPTFPSRTRSRTTDIPPFIDEQKLEVLPLFEDEPRTVPPVIRTRSRSVNIKNTEENVIKSTTSASIKDIKKSSRTVDKYNKPGRSRTAELKNIDTTNKTLPTRDAPRSRFRGRNFVNTKDTFQTSATENNEVKFTKPMENIIPTSLSVGIETKLESSTESMTKTETKPAQVRESIVVSQSITEVTSKRTVPRRRNTNEVKVKTDKPKVSVSQVISRGKKKSGVKLSDTIKKSKLNSEEIEESDNYPEAFKALIQSKKNKKESRSPSLLPLSLKSDAVSGNKNVVTASSMLPSLVTVSSEVSTREFEDDDNELEPISSRITPRTLSRTPRTTKAPRTSTTRTATTSRIITSTARRTTATPKSTISSTSRTTTTTTTPRSTSPITVTRFSRGRPLITKAPETTTDSLRKQTFPSRKSSKVVRSTAQPPSTTPLPREPKTGRGIYNRKKIQEDRHYDDDKGVKDVEDHILLSTRIPKPTVYKKSSRQDSKYRNEIASRGAVIRSTTTPPAYIPTIPSVYVPTIPTFTPPTRSTVYTFPGAKDGLEAISFDDPVNNTIPSANLVKGDYLSSSENSIYPLVKDGTTEKPVSIIERIINSITAINSTSPLPELTKQTATGITTESSSAILKLATKKSLKSDKTKTDPTTQTLPVGTVTQTTEKSTTIIERILSSLSAIQATDETNFIQVGKDFNTISASSTTPIPSVTKSSTSRSTLPAQISTSLNPLSILDEITPEQALQKRTIGRLLDILNGLIITTEPSKNVVVVTPKTSSFVPTNNGVSTIGISSPIPFTTTSIADDDPSRNSIEFTSNHLSVTLSNSISPEPLPLDITELFTSITKSPTTITAANTDSVNTISDSISTTTEVPTVTIEQQTSSTVPLQTSTSSVNINSRIQNSATSQTTTPLFAITEPLITTTEIPITTAESTTVTIMSTEVSNENLISTKKPDSTTFSSVSEAGLDTTTNTVSLFTLLSTLPSLQKFEVSPGSVSVFSANDLSNFITSDDLFSTVTIASRSNFDNTATTESSSTTEAIVTTLEPTTLSSTDEFTEGATTLTIPQESITTLRSSGTTKKPSAVNNTNGSSKMTNNSFSSSISNRSGRLLDIVQDPIQNSIDISTPSTTTSTTPDYFIFAVLNNNTILRKRPPTIPNKDTPFLIVGLYPNNTIVRKFPNGTLVPMEQIIRVETNTVPILEANALSLEPTASTTAIPDPGTLAPSTIQAPTISTSTIPSTVGSTTGTTIRTTTAKILNTASPSSTTSAPTNTEEVTYVTASLPSSTTLIPSSTELFNVRTTTVGTVVPESNTILSTTRGSTTTQRSSSTLPTLSEFFNGRTLEAFNSIINSSTTNTNTEQPNYQTLQVNQVDMTTLRPGTINPSTTGISETTTIIPTTMKMPQTTTLPPKPIPLLSRFSGDVTTLKTTTQSITTTSAVPVTTTTKTPITTTFVPRRGGMKFSDLMTTTLSPRRQTTPKLTSTPLPSPTFIPIILSTLFPTLFEPANRQPTTGFPYTSRTIDPITETIAFAATTQQPTTITTTRRRRVTTTPLPTTTTTIPTTTTASTTAPTTTRSRTTTELPSIFTVLPITASPSTKRSIAITDLNTVTTPTTTPKLKQLTDEQKKNLETLAELEKEQAMLLRQLSLLTSLGFGGAAGAGGAGGLGNNIPKPPSTNSDLASRVVQLAVERDKVKTKKPSTTSTEKPKSTTKKTKKITTTDKTPTSIQDQIAKIEATRQPNSGNPSLEDVLKQYDLGDLTSSETTPGSIPSFGKSSDAVLAQLLKEQGISPSTPKSLEGVFEATTRKSRPRATTQRPPGRLMQGLNWLLNALAPPPPTTTKKPKSKPKKPKKPPVDQELLTNSPTHITPVVTSSPSVSNSLSQDDIQKLIKQLEGLQKDPSKGALDLTQIKSLQTLINTDEGVQVLTNGEHGTTSRRVSTRKPKSANSEKRKSRKSTTEAPPISVSNSVEENDDVDEEFASTTSRVRAPIGFRPVPGVDDTADPFIRSNLVTAAVNVTRAISGFLGSALQGAAQSFQSLLGSGSRLAGSFAQGSSLLRQE